MQLNYDIDFNEEEIEYLKTLSTEELQQVLVECQEYEIKCDTNQQNRKILLNSLYGALGNIHFRMYDLRNATAITLFGQVAIQWIARKVNEYLNKLIGSTDVEYVFYCDTDSIYVNVEALVNKIGLDKFDTTTKLVDFLDNFGKKHMEPVIDTGYRELCEYMNNREHLMFMDREAIACPPIGSKGIGGFWTAKKRYALLVWDMEGVRYTTPKLKIMGLETQKSSTPKSVQKALKESIRLMLHDGEDALHTYFKQYEREYKKLNYKTLAKVSAANNIQAYNDGKGYPLPGCPGHIKPVLAYQRICETINGAAPIRDGDKVMILPLKDGNRFREKSIAWPSGIELPKEIREDVIKFIDYPTLFGKSFIKPLETMCIAAGIHYEPRGTLSDMFSFM